MFALMLVLGGLGLLLFVGGPWIVRWTVRWVAPGARDTTGLSRLVQLAGIVLIVAAVLLRPHNPETAAFPPPPDSLPGTEQPASRPYGLR